jgi:hypothetical protein
LVISPVLAQANPDEHVLSQEPGTRRCQVRHDLRPRARRHLRSRLAGTYAHSMWPLLRADALPQFFLREEDVGKPRAAVTVPRLAELNAYVPVRDLGGKAGQPVTVELIQGFQVRALLLLSDQL